MITSCDTSSAEISKINVVVKKSEIILISENLIPSFKVRIQSRSVKETQRKQYM